MKTIALIPLRGGSKSIPKKNIKSIGGKPLCFWVIEAALQSEIFSQVIVSTDSFEIAGLIEQNFPQVTISIRPDALATDTASTESVMIYESNRTEYDVMCLIQATSPLTQAIDFQNGYKLFQEGGYDSLVTGVRQKRFFWDSQANPINYNPLARPRRQDFEGWLMENGAFYFTKKSILDTFQCRLGGKIGTYEMSEEHATELDEPSDWLLLEQILLQRNQKPLQTALAQIKFVVTDVDGTLTDAGMYYTAQGDFMKKFNTRDAKGLELLRDTLGWQIMILTREDIEIVRARARKLKIEHCYTGVLDKVSFLKQFLTDNKLSWDNIAYFGDDVNDLEPMKLAGFSACPSNAEDDIKAVCHYIATEKGGEGAVRNIANHILKSV